MGDIIVFLLTVIIASMLFSFAVAFPLISLLYRFKITRRLDYDFTTVIEKVKLKAGVPIMGGLIIVLSVIVLNLTFNPDRSNQDLLILLFIFTISALLGGFDDVLNIYGRERAKLRPLNRTLKLIRVHSSIKKRAALIIGLPWAAYKRFFFMLGSNPGKGIQAHEKIIVQSIAGIALGIGVYSYTNVLDPGLVHIPIFDVFINIGFLIIPFAWITVLLMTNAVNLADGMDALAASQLLFSYTGFFVIAIVKGEEWIMFLIATVIGSLITYLYFNIPPARFQMGDVGSLALGALLAGVAFMVGEPLLLLVISAPFAVTLLSAVIQGLGRRVLGRRLLRMAPIHYHFQMKNGWSEEKVVMRLALFGFVMMIIGLWIFFIDYYS